MAPAIFTETLDNSSTLEAVEVSHIGSRRENLRKKYKNETLEFRFLQDTGCRWQLVPYFF
jgi:hypothetical protein